MESSTVIKPEHGTGQKEFIFTQEHEDLRASMEDWVKKELHPHRNEWEDTKWPDSAIQRAGELGNAQTGTQIMRIGDAIEHQNQRGFGQTIEHIIERHVAHLCRNTRHNALMGMATGESIQPCVVR